MFDGATSLYTSPGFLPPLSQSALTTISETIHHVHLYLPLSIQSAFLDRALVITALSGDHGSDDECATGWVSG